MISFIVIGRNEGYWLKKCITAIQKACKTCNLETFEIIYIDSDSEDNSIDIAKNCKTDVIIRITKRYNAAIARNTGALTAKGDYLVFLDADMEICSSFLQSTLKDSATFSEPYFSGDIINYYYNEDNKYLKRGYYFGKKIQNERKEHTTGGCFCIKKDLWFSSNGMKPYMRRSQDLDFGYRMSQDGHNLLRISKVFVIHHTINYTHQNRVWKILRSGNFIYRGLLYRENAGNKYVWRHFIRSDYTLAILTSGVFLSVFYIHIAAFVTYLAVILFRSIIKSDKYLKSYFTHIIYYIIRDIQILFGIIFFFPKRKPVYDIEYIQQ